MIYNTWLVFATIGVAHVLGWDGEGHRIVARVSGNLMTHKAHRFVRDHLSDGLDSQWTAKRAAVTAMVRQSTWADTCEWSDALHFSHTPYRDCKPFVFERDCGLDGSGRCIVSAIANYTQRASDIDLTSADRAEAIKFLIHFVADIHQGLHVGFAQDFGGTAIHLDEPAEYSLHEVWDSYLLLSHKASLPAGQRQTWYSIASDLLEVIRGNKGALGRSYRMDSALVNDGSFAAAIATETATTVTCNSAYQHATGVYIPNRGHSLSEAYVKSRRDIVLVQFMKAGVRLSQLLDSISAAFYRSERMRAAAAAGPAPAAAGVGSSNPFDAIYIDADPEDSVYEPGMNGEDSDMLPEDEEIAGAGAGSAASSVTTTNVLQDVEGLAMSPEEKKALKNKLRRQKAALAKRKVEGIDVASLVLVKFAGSYTLTYKQVAETPGFVAPKHMLVVHVRFRSEEHGTPIVIDMDVFDESPSMRLRMAICRHLGWLPPDVEGVPPAVPELILTNHHLSPFSELMRYSTMSESDQRAMLPELRPDAPVPQVKFGKVSFDERARAIAATRPTAKEIRRRYEGKTPSAETRIGDWIRANHADLLVAPLGEGNEMFLVTRFDLFADKSNLRWVFNIFGTLKEVGSSADRTAIRLLVDVRVIDEDIPSALLLQLQYLGGASARNRRVREIVKGGEPPILPALLILETSFKVGPGISVPLLAALESVTVLERSDMPFATTVEVVLRSPADRSRILASTIA